MLKLALVNMAHLLQRTKSLRKNSAPPTIEYDLWFCHDNIEHCVSSDKKKKKMYLMLYLCTQSNVSQSSPQSNVKQQFKCLISKLFWCRRCRSKSTFNTESDTMPLLPIYKKLWTPSSLSLNLTSFLICATKNCLMPTKATTLIVETPLLSCIKVWCLCSWDNWCIQLQTILQIAPHVLYYGIIMTLLKWCLNKFTTPRRGIQELWERVCLKYPNFCKQHCMAPYESMPRRINVELQSMG
jgi:hypothetical protein